MMPQGSVSSLSQLREEKMQAAKQVDYAARRLRNDVTDIFYSRGSISSASPNKYLSYLGYAFTAYKVISTVTGFVKMFRKKKK